jgi:ribosomal protein L12E/L44/L45/RPP1/RPP2
MPKKADLNHSNGHGSGRVKFRYADADRYVDFDMENASAAVADGIKSLANALSGRNITAPVRTLPAARAANAVAPPVVDQEEIQFPPQDEQAEQEDSEEVAAEEPENGNGGGPKRTYNFKAPKFMNELNFSTAAKTLEDFMGEKGNPTDMMDKYIVTVVWFKDFMKIDEVTVHHIYTAFDHVGWKAEMPVNPSIPLRDLKSKKHMLTREPGAEGYKLNFKGEQYVGKMGATK